jgi:two-component sensor histidine kinase
MTPNQEIIVTRAVPQLPSSGERVLLRELDHRIINEFACAISAVSLAAARTKNEEVKGALSDVAQLLYHYADVHRALQMPEQDAFVEAAAYLGQLCLSISRSKLEYREIALVLVAEPLRLEADRCWRLAVIMHELINNAARHAFARGSGEIRVQLMRAGSFVECRVLDNGSSAAKVQPGRGLKIIDELAKGLDGRLEHTFGSRGSIFALTFPYTRTSMESEDTPAEIVELTLDEPARDGLARAEYANM